MNIHIYPRWVYIEENNIERIHVLGQQIFISRHDGMMQVRTFDEAIIDEKKLFAACLFGKFGLADKSVDFQRVGMLAYRYQTLIELAAHEVNNPLAQIAFGQMKNLLPIVVQRKKHARIRQSNALKFLRNMLHLDLVALQKIASGGNIEK